MIDISDSQEIYSVSQLNREARLLLEENFPLVWVEGEISNFAAPQSGHWYFSLKDANAQVRCAMFRPQNRHLPFKPKEGMQVLAKVRVSLYEGRGDFQLLVDFMEEAGEGKLRQAFEALKKQLAAKGLFDSKYKKTLPTFPQCIGVITSPTGAAIRDILNVLKRRYANVPVIIYPTAVQGETAAPNIVKAIQIANQRKECDALIIARGGGSLEDLWPFNDERVAYSIFESRIPIVSGVGHEVDFTIADFVADVRAPTPSAAAEIITPDKEELLAALTAQHHRLKRFIKDKLRQLHDHVAWSQKHLQQQHPKRRLQEQIQRLDFYEIALRRLQTKYIIDRQAKLHTLQARLLGLTPAHQIQEIKHRLTLQNKHLQVVINKSLQHTQQLLSTHATQLDAISPLATLKRGYAIATREEDNSILQRTEQVNIFDKIRVRLQYGTLKCQVLEKETPNAS